MELYGTGYEHKAIFNRTLGVLNPSTNLRSSLVGRSERSAFQNCIPLTAPIEFFNRIDPKRSLPLRSTPPEYRSDQTFER